MENNSKQTVRKKRVYKVESKFFETDGLNSINKPHPDHSYVQTPKRPLTQWESQDKLDQFDEDLEQ